MPSSTAGRRDIQDKAAEDDAGDPRRQQQQQASSETQPMPILLPSPPSLLDGPIVSLEAQQQQQQQQQQQGARNTGTRPAPALNKRAGGADRGAMMGGSVATAAATGTNTRTHPTAGNKAASAAAASGTKPPAVMAAGGTSASSGVKWESRSLFPQSSASSNKTITRTTTKTASAAVGPATLKKSEQRPGSNKTRMKQPSAAASVVTTSTNRRGTHNAEQSLLTVDSRPGSLEHLDNTKSEKYFKKMYAEMRVQFWDRYANPPLTKDSRYSFAQFNIMEVLGEGSFGKVLLVEHNQEPRTHFALKVMIKSFLVEQMQVRHVMDERRMLHACRHPNLIHMDFVFKDNVYLFIGLPFVNGGDFFSHLLDHNVLDEPSAKFFAGQVFLAFEYLHMHNVAYRDLKPENILMEGNGYIKITDFGFAKVVPGRTWTLCGTPEYLAPEIILRKGYNKCVDWWAMGVFVYELIVGVTPFYNRDASKMYSKICNGRVTYPRRLSKSAVHLISRLIKVDPTRRIGNLFNGVRDIKYHTWFNTVDWIRLYEKKEEPPWRPRLDGPLDTHYFETFPFDGLETSSFDQYAVEFEDF